MEGTIAITFKELLSLFNRDNIIELYTEGNNEPWYANKVYILESEYGIENIPVYLNELKISSKFAGYDKSHVMITFEKDPSIIEHKEDWWDRLRLATPDEISEMVQEILKEVVYEEIKTSSNEVALTALESGQCDAIIKEASSQLDFDTMVLGGFTKLDMINAKTNPTNSRFRKTVLQSIDTSLKGESGKAFMNVLFGKS